MEKRIKEFLEERKNRSLFRSLAEIEPGKEGLITVAGKRYFNFSSNDYLGLSSHPAILEAAREASAPVFGSSSSRLMTGSSSLHHELERRIASFKGKEAALVFNSGYQANVGVISALFGKDDAVFADKYSHASIIDGVTLSGAKLYRFRHNDFGHLEELLAAHSKDHKNALVVTETVFSMDGDAPPLNDIAALKKKYDFIFMADEAHATGIFGKNGSGMLEETGTTGDCDIVMGTFGKALGGYGAYVATTALMREYLINSARSFIYSTSLPPAVINAGIASLDIVKNEPFRRKALLKNAAYLREALKNIGFNVAGSSQIVPVFTGPRDEDAVRLADHLKAKDFWAMAVRPPTVPRGMSRVRLSVTYNHAQKVLDNLINVLMDYKKAL